MEDLYANIIRRPSEESRAVILRGDHAIYLAQNEHRELDGLVELSTNVDKQRINDPTDPTQGW